MPELNQVYTFYPTLPVYIRTANLRQSTQIGAIGEQK